MRCIILEDEIPAQMVLQNYIAKLQGYDLLASFQTALEANYFLRQNSVDVLFLDINLPDISGMDFIKTLYNPPKIIMTTAYPNYAAESFEETAIKDYLVKPFSFERFLKALNKLEDVPAINTSAAIEPSVFINVDKTQHRVYFKDILYMQSDRNYITIVTKSTKLTYIGSLKDWLLILPNASFLQIHKSFLVNFHAIHKLVGNTAFVGNEKLPIGRVYKNNLLTILNA